MTLANMWRPVRVALVGVAVCAAAGCGGADVEQAPPSHEFAAPAPLALPSMAPLELPGPPAAITPDVGVAPVRVFGVTASDATTLRLASGQKVRLLGVVAPDPGGCHAAEAVKDTEEMLRSPVINVVYPPDAGSDEFGQRWVYVSFGYEGSGSQARDMGLELAAKGWVAPLPVSPDPADYERKVKLAADHARLSMYGASDLNACSVEMPPVKLPAIQYPQMPKFDPPN